MHPEHYYGFERTRHKKPTLEELKEKVERINEAINSVSKCDLDVGIKDFILSKLRNEKAELIRLMHQKVDEL